MLSPEAQQLIRKPQPGRLRDVVFYLARDPLPYRKANYTLPGHEKSTLDEADEFIETQLTLSGYQVEREACRVQAFRRDPTKPKAHQYSPPSPDDPWFDVFNLYARKPGSHKPDETILLVSHKDSQSWIDSPGANDNAIGTAGNLEAARALAGYPSQRTLCFLFCNEEHTPWTSEIAAQNAKSRGEEIIAVFNLDGIGVKAPQDAGRLINLTGYCTAEGQMLAALMEHVNRLYALGLEQSGFERPFPNDDDGSFVKAGFPAAVINIGSFPYADPHYHLETDVPENCDYVNAAVAVQATIAAVLHLDAFGFPAV